MLYDVQLHYPVQCWQPSAWVRIKAKDIDTAMRETLRTGPKSLAGSGRMSEYLPALRADCDGHTLPAPKEA